MKPSVGFRTAKLFGASVVLSLLLGEVLVRWFIPVRNVGPAFSEYDPVYGKRLKPNFSCERIAPEFRMQFTTNSLGFRGPEPPSFPERGLLFLGDSFTQGLGVTDGEAFPDRIRHKLNQRHGNDAIPVINAGIGNLGTGRWIKFLRSEGRRFQPRCIVLQLTDNDFWDNVQEGFFSIAEDDSLIEHDIPPPGHLRLVQNIIEAIPVISYSYLIGLIREAHWYGGTSNEDPRTEEELRRSDRLTYRLLETLFDLCRQERWPVILITVELTETRFNRVQEFATAYEVPVVNPPARSQRPDLYFAIDGHWNAQGHEHVAALVLAALDTARVLDQWADVMYE